MLKFFHLTAQYWAIKCESWKIEDVNDDNPRNSHISNDNKTTLTLVFWYYHNDETLEFFNWTSHERDEEAWKLGIIAWTIHNKKQLAWAVIKVSWKGKKTKLQDCTMFKNSQSTCRLLLIVWMKFHMTTERKRRKSGMEIFHQNHQLITVLFINSFFLLSIRVQLFSFFSSFLPDWVHSRTRYSMKE